MMRTEPRRTVLSNPPEAAAAMRSAARRCRTKLLVLLLAFGVLPSTASFAGEPGLCLTSLSGIDGCTANESAVSAINILEITKPCVSLGDTLTGQFAFELEGTNTNRYDIGVYLNVNGGSALSDIGTEACFHELLIPPGAVATECEADGFGPFVDHDTDSCGDIRKSTAACTAIAADLNAIRALTKGLLSTYEDVEVQCADNPDAPDGYLDMDACSAYHNEPGQADACSDIGSSTFTDFFEGTIAAPTGAGDPGTSSKCNCSGPTKTIPATPIPDLALSCSCGEPSASSGGFVVECNATITNSATLRPSVTGVNATEPGAGATYDFDLISSGPGTIHFEPITENSDASVPTAGPTVNWVPKGGQNSPTNDGVIGAGESYVLTFEYSGNTNGSHSIAVNGDWTDGINSADDVLVASPESCSFDVTVTYASIVHVSAELKGKKQVELIWETSTEVGTVGYDLYRLDPVSGDYVQANQNLLPASQNTNGGFYRFVDRYASPSAQMTYKILERTTGMSHWHGPYELMLQSPLRSSRLAKAELADNTDLHLDLGHYQARAKGSKPGKKSAKNLKKGKGKHQSGLVVPIADTGEQIRIEVRKDGIYSLAAREIAARLGTSVKEAEKTIRKGKYVLSNRGNSVDWEAEDGNLGIRFFGTANDSIYSDANVYWLSHGAGQTMSATSGATSVPAQGLTFASTRHFEQDLKPRYYVADDVLEDYWYWLITAPGWGEEATALETPAAAASGDAKLAVELYSFTPTATFDVWLNGTPLGTVSVTGVGKHADVPIPFDPSLLQSLLQASNSLKVQGVSGVTNVDSFDLRYTRDYVADDNRLFFTGGAHSTVTVTGFDTEAIQVYDVSNPLKPVRIENVLIDTDDSYRVTMAPASSQTPYLAVGSGGESAAVEITAYTSTGLRSAENAFDYLVVGPGEFADSALVLVDHRANGGYRAAFVDVRTIMDEFNDGLLDPEAIRTFLKHAHFNWSISPELVTIAGGGSFDYKSNVSSGNWVPPLMVTTRYGGLASTENGFGDFSGSPVPEIFVSRIPAATSDDLSAYIAKLINYEMSGYDSWQDRVVFAADNAEPSAGDFPLDSADLVSLMPGGIVPEEMYVGNGPGPHLPPYYTSGKVADLLKGAFDSGAAVVNWVGHAGVTQLANENLLNAIDIPGLSNQGKLPLVTALTCNMGFYALPNVKSLAEALILEPDVGAIGVWGPTLLSGNNQAVDFGVQLLPNLVQTNGTPFGHVAKQALQDFLTAGGDPELIPIYDFFGDAALQLK